MGETYYDVLGVGPDATQSEIADAYRERVIETHPDRNDDPDAAEQFKRVKAAESVLTDELERARYDRLGHDSYRRWDERFGPETAASDTTAGAGGSSTATDPSSAAGERVDRSGDSTSTRAETTRPRDESTTGQWWEGRGRDGSSDTDRSHHERQRRHRERRTGFASGRWARASHHSQSPTDHSADESATRSADSVASAGAARGGATERAGADPGDGRVGATVGRGGPNADGATRTGTDSGFTVHGWTDDVELTDDEPTLDRRTIVGVGCIALLYPLLVYWSLTPQFPIFVNVVVAVCTLVLVGYLLTLPRLALATFGVWSLLVPIGLSWLPSIALFSLEGVIVLAAFWIPLGYAVAVWWALRP